MSTRAFLDRLYSTCTGGVVELRAFPSGARDVDDPRPVARARHVRHDAGTRRPECRARHCDTSRHDQRHRREPARAAGALLSTWTSRPTRPAPAPRAPAVPPVLDRPQRRTRSRLLARRRSRPTSWTRPSARARSPSSAGSRSTSTATSRRPTSPACCDCRARFIQTRRPAPRDRARAARHGHQPLGARRLSAGRNRPPRRARPREPAPRRVSKRHASRARSQPALARPADARHLARPRRRQRRMVRPAIAGARALDAPALRDDCPRPPGLRRASSSPTTSSTTPRPRTE